MSGDREKSPVALAVDTTWGQHIDELSQNSPTSTLSSSSTLTVCHDAAHDIALGGSHLPADEGTCAPDAELSLLDVAAALARKARGCEERVVNVFVADHMAQLTEICPGLVVDGQCILSYVDDVAEVLTAEGQADWIPILHETARREGVTTEVRAFLSRWRLSLIETLGAADISDFDSLSRCFSHDVREHAAIERLAAIVKKVVTR